MIRHASAIIDVSGNTVSSRRTSRASSQTSSDQRVAGIVKNTAAGETTIECLKCDDEDIVADDANCEDADRQADALKKI